MRFDVIIGNPPYQTDGDGGTRTIPLYDKFITLATTLNPRHLCMIVPSRWMAGGLGLTDFRTTMLNDTRIRELVDYPNATDVFPGVDIKGGVCYFLWTADTTGPCNITVMRDNTPHGPTPRHLNEHDILVRDSRALPILRKITAHNEPTFRNILAVDKEFGFTSNFTNFNETPQPGDIPFYYNRAGKRLTGGIPRTTITKSTHLIDTWKVLIPQAGSGATTIPDPVLGTPLIAPNPSACTQTYLFAYTNSREAAESIETYVKTRLFRFLVSLRKMTQHATHSTYQWVPQQDWTQPWTDADLYTKYGLTDDEITYIETMIKEMP